MRNRSSVLLVVLSAALAALAGCKKQIVKVDAIGDRAAGEMVRVEGRLSHVGSEPNVRLVLVKSGHVDVLIDAGELRDELMALADLPVAIEGDVTTFLGEPALYARRYELLRLPSGEVPVIGVLSLEGEYLILTARDGSRYWIRGDHVGVIRDFVGATAWIAGSVGDVSLPDKPAVPYWVTGYGVLKE